VRIALAGFADDQVPFRKTERGPGEPGVAEPRWIEAESIGNATLLDSKGVEEAVMAHGDYERLSPRAIDQVWQRSRVGHAPEPTASNPKKPLSQFSKPASPGKL